MLSKAFGDWELKQYGVSCQPHVTKIEINNDDLFVVMDEWWGMGCYGRFWNF